MRTRTIAAAAGVVACAGMAHAQSRFVVLDRTSETVWLLNNGNGNSVIEEPGEVSAFFNGSNGAGTLVMVTPGAMAVRRDGLVAVGDSGSNPVRRCVYLLRDGNGDWNANGPAESAIVADGTNAAGIPLAAPAGAAFDSRGRLYISNSGNASGADAIYRLVDLNGDGDFQDNVGGVNEITPYVADPFFGAGNGPYVPAELVFDANHVLYMHDTGASTHGVYRFEDLNGNGRADDPGEATAFFTSANASGVTIATGFGLALDPIRARSLYFLQTATGPVQQLYRLTDGNGNGTANDAGEAVLVWSTSEAGFNAVAVVALYDGRVLVTDGTGKRVILLTDLDADGLFTTPGERTTFFANATTIMGAVRQLSIVPCPGDWDRNGHVEPADIAAFVNDWFASLSSGRFVGDFNFDGTVNPADIAGFVNAWFAALGGGC